MTDGERKPTIARLSVWEAGKAHRDYKPLSEKYHIQAFHTGKWYPRSQKKSWLKMIVN